MAPTPRGWAFTRERRVLAFLIVVVVLSLGDLYMTLLHLRSFGMLEANPLARQIIAHGSTPALVAWKLATVSLAVGLLYIARRRPAGEIGAAVCCLVLMWLTGRWVTYSDQVSGIGGDMQALTQAQDEPRWVSLADDLPGEPRGE